MTTTASPWVARLGPMMPPRSFSRIRQLDPLAAIQALSRQEEGQQAVALLAHFLGHSDAPVRVEAVRALANCGATAVGFLRTPLADADATVRREAAAALGKLGPVAAVAVPELATALKDDDPRVRTAATLSLGLLGPAAAPAIPGLIGVLKGVHLILSRLAAQALSRIGPAAAPALTEALATADSFGRREAAWALGEIGPALAQGAAELPALPVRPTPPLDRKAASEVATVPVFLGQTVPVQPQYDTPPPARPVAKDPVAALSAALEDPDLRVREAAARALSRICYSR